MKKQLIVIITIFCACMLWGAVSYFRNSPEIYPIKSEEEGIEDFFEMYEGDNAKVDIEPIILTKIFVDVKGAVISPGVYEVEEQMRVIDVIKLAGGFSDNSNQDGINLSQKVYDEMVIYVPNMDEDIEWLDFLPESQKSNGKININTATDSELQSLPGIGQVKAQAIVTYREQFGLFQSIEDIVQVSGIGERTFESIKEFIEY